MFRDESCKPGIIVPLIQKIAADDQIVSALHQATGRGTDSLSRHRGRTPMTVPVFHRQESVGAQILFEESLRERVAITRGDIGAAPMTDEAREGEPATDLQDVFIGANPSRRHASGQIRT